MRAGLRFGMAAMGAALAAVLTLGAAPLLAQTAPAPDTNTAAAPPPANDTIGPRELQNFSLNGTVTRPAEAPQGPPPRPVTMSPATRTGAAPERPASVPPRGRAAPTSSVTVALPAPAPVASSVVPAPATKAAPEPGFELTPAASAASADQRRGLMPWLLAGLLLVLGAGWLVWSRRSRLRYAAAGEVQDLIVDAPAPAPPLQRAAAPRPAPPAAAPARPSPSAGGIVSTRIRPWLEIEFSPIRCLVENDKATIQFDVAVFNSGAAPARDVLVEASMFNAGPAQDEEIGAFFAHPVALGSRIPTIPPLQRVELKSAVQLERAQIRQFEVEGRLLFVPLIGFNALYRWSAGDGQTSASYLVGRHTDGDKMAPLRLDLGPRIFRGLGARQHSVGVRT